MTTSSHLIVAEMVAGATVDMATTVNDERGQLAANSRDVLEGEEISFLKTMLMCAEVESGYLNDAARTLRTD
jgi:hypothetical protein